MHICAVEGPVVPYIADGSHRSIVGATERDAINEGRPLQREGKYDKGGNISTTPKLPLMPHPLFLFTMSN